MGYRRGGWQVHRPKPKEGTTKKTCLRCDRKFPSTGADNRLCQACVDANNLAPSPAVVHSLAIPRRWD